MRICGIVRLLLLPLLLSFAGATPCSAQAAPGDPAPANAIGIVLVNAAIGGGTAAIGRLLAGKPVKRHALVGAAAGATVFLGKWIVSRNGSATNLIGRTLAAVGSSQISDAAGGEPFLSHVVIPYGIVNFYVDRSLPKRLYVRLNLAASVATLINATTAEQTFRSKQSLLSGVPTFGVNPDQPSGSSKGTQIAGVVTYRPGTRNVIMAEDQVTKMIGHELVHVAQSDFLFTAYSSPLETLLFDSFPGGRGVHRFLDIGLHVPLWSGVNSVWPYASRPWEREAVTLAGR